ncbi:two-component regulator propeller domain-containing protein [Undibacterium sp. TJN19]|uniref:two-component regulator propeller domain-containing protein n=1 Tax=Undibacterium sp. TJN19 TaxID=3413055 RepID=UPI003BF171AE
MEHELIADYIDSTSKPQILYLPVKLRLPSFILSFLCLLLLSLITGMGLTPSLAAEATLPVVNENRWLPLSDKVFQNLTTDNGLPGVVTQAIAEDRQGFIWFGTQGGLARWDGYRFQIYQQNLKDVNALPESSILSLHIDASGRLWIGTNGGGLARYDAVHDRFVRVPVGKNGTADGTIYDIASDGSTGLWIATSSGLDHYLPDTGQVRHLRHDEKDPDSLPSGVVRTVMQDKSGTLWIGTQKGLVCLDGKTQKLKHVDFTGVLAEDPNIRYLQQSSDGHIWVGTANHGVYIIDPLVGLGQPMSTKAAAYRGEELRDDTVTFIKEVAANQIWIGTVNHGIVMLDTRLKLIRRQLHDAAAPFSLIDDTPESILQDRSGTIWVGTDDGVSRHNIQQTAVLAINGGAGDINRIRDKNVTAVFEMDDGRIWLGLKNNGIQIIDPDAATITWLRPDARHLGNAPPDTVITAFTRPINQKIYIGSQNGLYRSDTNGQNMQRLHFAPFDAVMPINAISQDGELLWVGAEDGLWRIDLSGDLRITTGRAKKVINDGPIEALAFGDDNLLWVGTRGSGLYRLDKVTLTHKQFLADKANATGISSNIVTSLLLDKRKRLWVATLGGGINISTSPLASSKLEFQQLQAIHGMPNDLVDALGEDTSGKIWASTDGGIVVIDPLNFKVKTLQRADGVASSTYWAHSGVVTTHGELLFGGVGGLTIVRPPLLKQWDYEPQLVFTHVETGGKPDPSSQLHNQNPSTPVLIHPEGNTVAVEFSALDYSAPTLNKYAYQLEGYDASWIEVDSNHRIASYTNLPPGDYRLRIKASNREGRWAKQELSLAIRVLPAWYQTWWFVLLIVLAIAVAIFVLIQKKTSTLLRRQRQLEVQVLLRTADLNTKQSELSVANSELLAANAHLSIANTQLAQTNETMRLLGEVGRGITAILNFDKLYQSFHQHVEDLLDASRFSIYRQNSGARKFELVFWRDMENRLADEDAALPVEERHVMEVAKSGQDLLLEAVDVVQSQTMANGMQSAYFVPLFASNKLTGVACLYSTRPHAYGEREKLMFSTICSFASVAMDNADAHQQLAQAIDALKHAQQQLIFQEKMTALGTLTAGVAHEFNNAVNFSHVGAQNLRADLDRFYTLLLNMAGSDADEEIITSFNDSFAGLQMHLKNVLDGTTQIRQVVRDLQTFTRLGESARKPVLIISSLLASIKLLHSQVNEAINIQCELAANPMIECSPGQLNQVFMNLILNAYHANKEKQAKTGNSVPGILIIRSSLDGNWLVIDFEDNGIGIKPEHLGRIFDPFFTTKEVGDGMGLGLSMSYSIIKAHKGNFTVRSEYMKGSCFTIRLPLRS